MNTLVGQLDSIAETWWPYIAHATWQSALVGLVVCAAVYGMRKWRRFFEAPPLRYGLLIIALLKFAAPPLIAVPYAAPASAVLQPSQQVRVEQTGKGLQLPALRETSPLAVETNDAPASETPLRAESATTLQRAVSPPALVSAPVATDGSRMWHSVRVQWKALLLCLHALGCILAGAYIVFGFLKMRRFAAQCETVEDEALQRSFDHIRERMGLRQRVQLLLTRGECTPMAFGVFRPRVVVPKRLVERMGPIRLEAVLAHELAHHRRRDLWLMNVENLLLVVWWFHPVFWLVRRELRSVREDCCDDLLLNAGIAERESYCEILLQAAGHMAQPRWARAALGICERFHPLGQRFKRIMDASLKRPRRLSWAGLLAVLALALLLIPGVRFVEGQATDNAAAVEAEIGRSYAQADADVKDFIKMTAERFGPEGLWLPENAFDKLTPEERAAKLKTATEFLEGPDGPNTCTALAEAGVLRDSSLLPGLVKVAWHMREGGQDNRTKWMAVAALGRLGDKSAVPVLIPLIDHYNTNVRLWARGSLVRLTGQNFGADKKAWADWANAAGPQTAISPVILDWASRQSEERMKPILEAQKNGAQQAPSGSQAPEVQTDAETEKEIQEHYAKADPEIQEYVRWTARTFGRSSLWMPANAFVNLSPEEREKKVVYLVEVLKGDYGRHLCGSLAEAGAIKDTRLLPGLIKAAAYQREDGNYDCRAKWMAVAALGRQDDESAVPTLVPLVDHGNKNTNMWAKASLVRLTGQNFGVDKQAWGKWWNDAGKQPPIDLTQLKPWMPASQAEKPSAVASFEATSAVPAGGTGPRKGILRFDGTNDFIHIPSARPLDLKENFSVSAWVRVDPDCGEGPVFYRGDQQSGRDPCQFFVKEKRMCFKMNGGQGTTAEEAFIAADLDGGWHYWTGVCDNAAGKLLLYKDGAVVAEGPGPKPLEYATSQMYNEIGAIDSGARGGSWGFFRGDIDQISVWNVVRKPQEIQQEFANGVQGNEPGLVALWTFDEEGQDVIDSSPSKCNAILGRTAQPDDSDPARPPADAPPAPRSVASVVNGLIDAVNRRPPTGSTYAEPWALEAELVAPLIHGDGVSVQPTESLPGTWSGGKLLRLQPTAPATYALSVPAPPGKGVDYTLMLWCSAGPDHGICELWVNGKRITQNDLYRPDGVARITIEAPLQVKDGPNEVEIKITGKNPASSGYTVGIDCGRLR